MFRFIYSAVVFAIAACILTPGGGPAWAADKPAATADGSATGGGAPTTYAKFIEGATAQRGLFTVWHKDGKVYLELAKDQIGRDFIETIVPGSGLGGNFVVWGNTDHVPAMLLRFERAGDKIALVWPNTSFVAPGSAAAQRALEYNFPQSVEGVGDIAATDETTGAVVFDLSSLLGDQRDMKNLLKTSLNTTSETSYSLDAGRTYFGTTKAFPKNVIVEADQTWSTDAAHVADVAPDARSLQMRVVYNFAQPPDDGDYRPRYADDRVGFYDAIYLQYDKDIVRQRQLRYIVRWNLQPSDPSKPISPAKHPMVFYLSNTIPPAYRPAIRDAMLAWNPAFERIGISRAIVVEDQPADADWDADDIRYNVIRWVTEAQASFGADSQTLYDPRTGQEFRTGILVSADVPLYTSLEWQWLIDPVRYGRTTDPMPPSVLYDSWQGTILHETGHNIGLQHNFIGSMAYTAKELQSSSFTRKHGIASTVMEYAPTNLWPQPYPQGSYFQTVLGPYDYYAIKWGYAAITGAKTPEAELPTLRRWAQAWSDPRFRYSSDEDAAWANGHAADPRSNQGDLTDDPLGWCTVQLRMTSDLMHALDRRLPHAGDAYETETAAFRRILGNYANCATLPAHFIGGQYLSRAHRGDPHAQPPIVPVPRDVQLRAMAMLDKYLFADDAWRFSSALLSHLGYSEWSGYGYVSWTGYGNLPVWAYDPPDRHDYPILQRVSRVQMGAIDELFQPLVLQRIEQNPLQASTRTLAMSEMFAGLQTAIYGDLGTRGLRDIGAVRRNLQTQYAQRLMTLHDAPPKGTPDAARALARYELGDLHGRVQAALKHGGALDVDTRAHLEDLDHRITAALK
ncbi:MAG: zinc-dependent metalloprotease [Candidatus Eremiobacteraeota bacterium]|nr:zinc-dependent metalloprotease [Candidatus Eremiobacteraeota bacterium]